MKKLLFLFIFCLLFQPIAEARDYVKLHMKEMKHAQKYGATEQYFADYSDEIKNKKEKKDNIILKDPKLITLGGYDEKTLQEYEKKLKNDEILTNVIASSGVKTNGIIQVTIEGELP